MRKWRVVSAEGWGPGFSGANCTFRITRRTEFLGVGRRGGRGRSSDTRTPTTAFPGPGAPGSGGGRSQHRGACFPHLLWLFSSSDFAQKARISKSTPQASGGEKVTSYTRALTPTPFLPSPLAFVRDSCPIVVCCEQCRAWGFVLCLPKTQYLAERRSCPQGEPLYSPVSAQSHP